MSKSAEPLNLIRYENLHEKFEEARKVARTGVAFVAVISLAGIGFVIWVIIKVMQHFDVI